MISTTYEQTLRRPELSVRAPAGTGYVHIEPSEPRIGVYMGICCSADEAEAMGNAILAAAARARANAANLELTKKGEAA